MGRAIERVLNAGSEGHVTGGVDAGDPPVIAPGTSVIIDFSGAEAAPTALRLAREAGVALVAGTTGLGPAYFNALEAAADEIPVLYAANMSLGVNLLRYLVREAARLLPAEFEAEIVELHHLRKRDAPSGTALALLESINAGRKREPHAGLCSSREGLVGERPPGEIGVFGVRGGNVAGEHTVYFFGENERIELTHRATDRDIFARGAARAGLWLANQAPGRYTIEDVLGL